MREYLTELELGGLGFKSVGKNPRVSWKCSFYDIDGDLGDNVRIDDFCVLKGKLRIGSFVHIASFGLVSGAHDRITIDDFVSLAARCTVLTGSDDYGAPESLNNSEYAKVIKGPVDIGLGAIVGVGSLILPNVTIGVGVSIGAHCIVDRSIGDGDIVRHPGWGTGSKVRDHERIKVLACRVLENMDGEV